VFVVTGHDHEGCFYKHNNHTTEYTIRSMMGGFHGYTAVLEIKATGDSIQPFQYNIHYTFFVIIYVITIVLIAIGIWLALLMILIFLRFLERKIKIL